MTKLIYFNFGISRGFQAGFQICFQTYPHYHSFGNDEYDIFIYTTKYSYNNSKNVNVCFDLFVLLLFLCYYEKTRGKISYAYLGKQRGKTSVPS